METLGRPNRGWMRWTGVRWTVGRMLTVGFAVALVALAVVGASAFTRLGTLMQMQQPANHSHLVLGGIGKLGDLVNQIDRAQRSYLADRTDESQQLYRETTGQLGTTIDHVQHDTAGDPVQQRTIAQIRALTGQLSTTEPAGDRDQQFARIGALVNAMHDHEGALLDERVRATDEDARQTRVLILAVSIGTAMFVAAAGRWITRRITSAALEVTAAAGRVIEGDVSRPADVTGPEELAQMARAVNTSMAAMAAARDEALAATAAKSAFLAAMSHEIRTPMNAVIGGTGLLNDDSLTAGQRELVGIVRGSAESLLVIINDILDFSKIEAGELTLDEQPANLRALVDDAVKLVALTADAKGLRLSVDTAADCPAVVVADEPRLRQILVNLLGNAVKFTDHGGVSVRVAAFDAGADAPAEAGTPDEADTPAEARRIGLRIAVQDTGIGIPADRLARLFVAFSQVDGSATRSRAGTGLGLVISQRLAEAMGGRITVRSAPDEGSTFTLEAYVGSGDGAAVPAVAVRPAADARAPGHPLHVLVAEDNSINQRVAELMLTRRGHAVDIVDNGADAVRAVHDVAYDLVLMDVRMPAMDGLEATERIRSEPPAHGAPRIVALTANATVDDQAAGRRAGMDDFLAKPIQEDDLDRMLAAAAGYSDAGRRLGAEDDDIRASVAAIAGADFANQVRLADILLAFAGRLPGVLGDLDEAIAAADHPRADRLAHSLKGSAATLGAHRLAGVCARLEAYAQAGDQPALDAGRRQLHELADVAARAVTAVAQDLVA